MSLIEERQLVHAPLASAERLLLAFIASHPGKDDGARLILRAKDFTKPAIITLKPDHQPGEMTPRFHVHWEAEEGGLYPVFDGTLAVGGDEDYNAFWLLLDGTYVPPGGIVGAVFDAVVGHRIAVATAKSLLGDMSEAIEASIAAEEEKKAGGR